jgi:hypothetical protein
MRATAWLIAANLPGPVSRNNVPRETFARRLTGKCFTWHLTPDRKLA